MVRISFSPPPSLRFSGAPDKASEEPQCSAEFRCIFNNHFSLSGCTRPFSAGIYAFFSA